MAQPKNTLSGKANSKNQTTIFNPKTKSQNTDGDTKPRTSGANKANKTCGCNSKKTTYNINADTAQKKDPKTTAYAKKVNSIGKTDDSSKPTTKSKQANDNKSEKGDKAESDTKDSEKPKQALKETAMDSYKKATQSLMNSTATKTGFGTSASLSSKLNIAAKNNADLKTTKSNSNSAQGTLNSASNQKSKNINPIIGQKGIKGGVNSIMAKTKTSLSSGSKDMESSMELCTLKDGDIISDILGSQKSLIKMYGTALCECDCQNLRSILTNQMTEAATDQFDAFLYMNQHGLYPTEQAEQTKVKDAIKMYSQKESAFNGQN